MGPNTKCPLHDNLHPDFACPWRPGGPHEILLRDMLEWYRKFPPASIALQQATSGQVAEVIESTLALVEKLQEQFEGFTRLKES